MTRAFLTPEPPPGPRQGETFDEEEDGARLNTQMTLVWRIVRDGDWHCLAEISKKTGAPEASVSARLRDLRRPEFGGWNVERSYVGQGLWRYRVAEKAKTE